MSTKTIYFTGEIDESVKVMRLDVLLRALSQQFGAIKWRIIDPIASGEPIDMILYCPNCGKQHIDGADGKFLSGDFPCPWDNPPHRSHLCHDCGCIWRPADVTTNGVADIKTEGKADTWVNHAEEIKSATAEQPVVQPIGEAVSKALENCRLYAARHRSQPWAFEILRFCENAGIVGNPMRTERPITDGSGREEREEFEKWLRLRYNSNLDPLRTVDGEYAEYIIQNMWLTWKARSELCEYTMIDTSEIHNKIKRIINDIREGIGGGSMGAWAATERQLCDPLLDAVLDEIHGLFATPPQSGREESEKLRERLALENAARVVALISGY